MHPYSVNSGEREKILIGLLFFSTVIAYLIYYLLTRLNVTIPWWIDTPSIIGVYAALYGAFNFWIWRISLLRRIGLVSFENLNGTWAGKVTYFRDNVQNELEVKVIIRQTWTNISICLEAAQSISHSTAGSIFTDDPVGNTLIYTYVNEPKANAHKAMHTHRGTSWLVISNNGKQLDGEYYTGRDRRTIGTILLIKSV